jgi:hypothetical protein
MGSASSSFLLQASEPPSSGDPGQASDSSAEALPVTTGEVRETFTVPLLNDVASGTTSGSRGGAGAGSKTRSAGPAQAAPRTADARAFFQEPPRPAARRPNAAEARSKARRCPTCGGVVAVGMSICQTCGLDLETNTRVALADDLAPEPTPRAAPLPIAVGIIGGISLLGSAFFAILTFALWLQGFDGYGFFVPVCLFGTFAAVQFLRRKSLKLLLMALTLGVVIDIVGLIAMPIYAANSQTTIKERTVPVNSPDEESVIIESVVNRLDAHRLGLGIGLILVYAAVSTYLLSPQVKRHFR